MTNDRRQFLRTAGASALSLPLLGGAPLPRVFAEARTQALANPFARETPPTLVCVYLRGGADALNIVVPYTNQDYYQIRPTIQIPPEKTEDEPGVVKLNDDYGLHPALGGLKKFWDAKQFSAVVNVGSPHPTRSHFDAQDFMEYAAPGDRFVRDGWLNRYLQHTKATQDRSLRAIATQGLLPRALRGDHPVLAVPRLNKHESEGLLDLFDDVYKTGGGMEEDMMGKKLEGGAATGRKEAVKVGRHTIETLRHFWEIVEKEPKGKQVKYPRGAFARRLQMLARVIKNGGGLEVAAIDLTGWDTHQGEGSTDGRLNRLLRTLNDGLVAFANDMGQGMSKVTVLVMSEFGRTVAENGNRGTDHGRGGCMLALGGPVNGGRIIGDYGSLKRKHLLDKRDLRVEIDFRTIFHEALMGTHQFKAPKEFFPHFTPRASMGLCRS